MIEYQIIDSPVGQIIVAERSMASGDKRIFFLEFVNNRSLDEIIKKMKKFYPNESEVVRIEHSTLSFEALFDINTISWECLEFPKGTALQKRVWETLFKLPYGTVVSYSQLAQMANYPNAIRAVASAVGANPISLIIPCHRVVRKEALDCNIKDEINYGEYLWGSDIKKELIEWERGKNSTINSQLNLRKRLFELSANKYKKFSQALIPTNKNYLLGVRVPELRALAKAILKGNWQEFIDNYPTNGGFPLYFEEIMVWGMVINGAKLDIESRLKYVEAFVPYIDNWSICDTFCTGAKWAQKNSDESWASLQPYLSSSQPYYIRYGVIMLMSYFLLPDKISAVFEQLEGLSERVKNYREYYVEMAIAWAIATAAAKFSDQTLTFLEETALPLSVLKKAAQKMRDSYRVSKEYKLVVTNLINSKI